MSIIKVIGLMLAIQRLVYTTPADPVGPGFFFLAYLYKKAAKANVSFNAFSNVTSVPVKLGTLLHKGSTVQPSPDSSKTWGPSAE